MKNGDIIGDLDEFESLLAGSGWVLLGNFLSKILYFIAFIVVIQSLEIANYGAFALAIAMFQVGTSFALFGFDNSIHHFLPKTECGGAKRDLIYRSILVVTLLSLITGFIILASSDVLAAGLFETPAAAPVFRIFAVSLPIAVIFRLNMNVLRALEFVRPRVYIENLLQPSIRVLFVLLVAYIGAGATGMAVAYLGTYLVGLILSLWFIYRKVKELTSIGQSGVTSRQMLSFSAPLFGVGLISMITGQIDTLLLGVLTDSYSVGIFRAIFTLSQNFLIIIPSLQFLFTPMFSRLVGEGSDILHDFYERVTRWAFYSTVGILMFVIIFAEPLLLNLFRPEYVVVADELRLLTLSSAIAAFLGFNSQALLGLGDSRVQLIGSVVLGSVNFLVDLALIPLYGVLGAVIGTVTATIVTQSVFSLKLYHTEGIHSISIRTLAPATYASASAFGLYMLGVSSMNLFDRSVVFFLFAATFLIVVFAVGGIENRDIQVGSKGLQLLTRRLLPDR